MTAVPPGTFLAKLAEALSQASSYNKQDQAPPAAVLWTDRDREWASLVPLLAAEMAIFTLGPYDPAACTGPAYWLRCLVDRALPQPRLEDGKVPILYLPAYSRQDVRSVDGCGPELRPLLELQYRGTLWAQKNGRDWTIAAFLQNAEVGLGIDVASDGATKEALMLALPKLAAEPIESLRSEAPIRALYLHALLNPDEVKKVLEWLSAPESLRGGMSPEEWEAFAAICRNRYSFDPDKDSVITVGGLLGQRAGPWAKVWARFAEAPGTYLGIPSALRQARPSTMGPLFDVPDSWPQLNEQKEQELRQALLDLARLDPTAARLKIQELEQEHKVRRRWVWSQLGQAPLARALEHLAVAAVFTQQSITGDNVEAVVHGYLERGWQADLAVLDALAEVESAADQDALRAALRTIYRPWLESGAIALQQAIGSSSANARYQPSAPPSADSGTCILFSDGLRFDVGQRLQDLLAAAGLACDLTAGLAALPTVTGTAKTSIAPAAPLLGSSAHGFDPALTSSGTTVNVNVLRRALESLGYEILQGNNLGNPTGRAWTELGNLDSTGHTQGLALARRVAEELRTVKERIVALLRHGWQRVVLVTDHGWLLVPGGLPKAELPKHLTEGDKGRCARLKEGALSEFQTVPWRWDASVRIAIAPGIHCFEAGKEYEHGGVSPQECIVPILTVAQPSAVGGAAVIGSVTWRRLRCDIQVDGAGSGLRVDLRTKAGDPTTSLAQEGRDIPVDGLLSLLVEDADREGEAVLVVITDAAGNVRAQVLTVVGGGWP